MWPKSFIGTVPEHDEPVVEGPVEHMLPHIALAGGGESGVHVGLFERVLHLRDANIHEAGVPVGAAALLCDPVGPHVAFLKNVYFQRLGSRQGDGLGVGGAGVAVEVDIGDAVVVNYFG